MSNTVFCLIDGGTYIHTTEYYKDLEEKKTVFLNKKQKWSGMKKKWSGMKNVMEFSAKFV